MAENKDIKDKKSAEEKLLEVAKFYFLNSKFDEAQQEFEKVLEINPKSSEAYCSLGLIYENKKDYIKAKEMYSKTLELDKENKVATEHISKITGMENE